MKKFFKKHMKNEKGMTLIELLAVIVILAIIAAIAVPAIGNIISNSRDSAKLSAASNILAGAKIATTANDCTIDADSSVTCSKDQLDLYVENVKKPEASGGATAVDAEYSAARSATGEWTVTYNGLVNFTSKKFSTDLGSVSGSITEAQLNEALSK